MIFNPVYGGASAPNLGSKTITANGTYSASSDGLDGYDEVTANVPNTYAAGDEGKVVSNGALVAQTSVTKTANGTYDTTLNNEVVVAVPGATLGTKSITANGTYDASDDSLDGYSSVTVNVSGGAVLGTKSITANGTYNASSDSLDGYSSVSVNVPAYDGPFPPFPTIPNTYQRVEYIEANGTQWCETTNSAIASGRIISIDFNSASTAEICMFGWTGSGGNTFECYTTGSNCTATAYSSNSVYLSQSGSFLNVRQRAIWKANSALNKSYLCMYRNSTGTNSYKYIGKIYRITVTTNDNLLAPNSSNIDYDYIPVKRISDSLPGFYEAVSGTFYPSTTGVDFVAGPDA